MTTQNMTPAANEDCRQPDEPACAAAMARADAYLRRLPLPARQRRELYQALSRYAHRLEDRERPADAAAEVVGQLHRLVRQHYRWVFDEKGSRLVARKGNDYYIPPLVSAPVIVRRPMTPDKPALAPRPSNRGRQ